MVNNLGFHCHRLWQIAEVILENGLKRGEFYHFPPEELPLLKKEIQSHDLAVSIHCPLVKPEWYPEPPTWAFLCDVEREKRELNLRMIRETMDMAQDLDAEYVVVHFPSPPSTDVRGLSYAQLKEIAVESAYRLALLSEEYQIPIHLEGFGPSPFLNVEFLAEVVSRFPVLRYCFDTGHMNLSAQRDGLDLYRFAVEVAPYMGSLHLWNNRGMDDYLAFRHIPVHPSQNPAQGWVDIARILEATVKGRPSLPVIFESPNWYPQALGNHDYRDGVRWVKRLLETLS